MKTRIACCTRPKDRWRKGFALWRRKCPAREASCWPGIRHSFWTAPWWGRDRDVCVRPESDRRLLQEDLLPSLCGLGLHCHRGAGLSHLPGGNWARTVQDHLVLIKYVNQLINCRTSDMTGVCVWLFLIEQTTGPEIITCHGLREIG